MTNRENLPFRKNCEGYFICEDGKIIARDTHKGFLEFPGGGVDQGEDPKEALKREALEEAGIIIKGDLEPLGVMHFIWGPDWAKTEKQKKRYSEFKGEEMYFFKGKVKSLVNPTGDLTNKEEGWIKERKMDIQEAIDFIENQRPFDQEIKDYRENQLNFLRGLKS